MKRLALAAALSASLGAGCAAPARMGLARVQVCLTAERSPSWASTRPQVAPGAGVCADFEAPPAPEGE